MKRLPAYTGKFLPWTKATEQGKSGIQRQGHNNIWPYYDDYEEMILEILFEVFLSLSKRDNLRSLCDVKLMYWT